MLTSLVSLVIFFWGFGGQSWGGGRLFPFASMCGLHRVRTVLLFFGFFGFNGGSVLKMNTVDNAISASLACVTTSLAGSGGGVAAILIHR